MPWPEEIPAKHSTYRNWLKLGARPSKRLMDAKVMALTAVRLSAEAGLDGAMISVVVGRNRSRADRCCARSTGPLRRCSEAKPEEARFCAVSTILLVVVEPSRGPP